MCVGSNSWSIANQWPVASHGRGGFFFYARFRFCVVGMSPKEGSRAKVQSKKGYSKFCSRVPNLRTSYDSSNLNRYSSVHKYAILVASVFRWKLNGSIAQRPQCFNTSTLHVSIPLNHWFPAHTITSQSVMVVNKVNKT